MKNKGNSQSHVGPASLLKNTASRLAATNTNSSGGKIEVGFPLSTEKHIVLLIKSRTINPDRYIRHAECVVGGQEPNLYPKN